jgi:plasmid stability protein
MPSLIIRDIPPELHRRLKSEAKKAHRSMSKEALRLLEEKLMEGTGPGGGTGILRELPAPYRAKFPLTNRLINKWKREGRE